MTMNQMEAYRDLRGRTIALDRLDADECRLINALVARAAQKPEHSVFRNWWLEQVDQFYSGRGLSRPQIIKTAGYRIGQDLAGRIGIAEGWMHPPDYRDELEELISANFHTRRAFCEAS